MEQGHRAHSCRGCDFDVCNHCFSSRQAHVVKRKAVGKACVAKDNKVARGRAVHYTVKATARFPLRMAAETARGAQRTAEARARAVHYNEKATARFPHHMAARTARVAQCTAEASHAGSVSFQEFLEDLKLSSFAEYFKEQFGVEGVSDFEGLGEKSWRAITNHLKEGRAFRLKTALKKVGLKTKAMTTEDSGENEEDRCCVCLELPKTIVFLPCRHLCSCQCCSELPALTNCPVCRCVISERMKVFG